MNGEKKWITGGLMASYFTCLVRTGGPGAGGLSFLLLKKVDTHANTTDAGMRPCAAGHAGDPCSQDGDAEFWRAPHQLHHT